MHEPNQLTSLLQEKYHVLHGKKLIAISPKDLADEVYKAIDPKKISPLLVQMAAILELRQLARAVCRQRNVESQQATEQSTLFDLQPRYPATRTMGEETEEVYVLREHLTVAERRENSSRLRVEGEAKMAHADALDAETDFLISTGKLAEEAPVET